MAGFTHNWRHIVPQFWQAAFAMSLVYLVATRVRRQQELDALAEKHEPIRRVWRFTMALLLAAFACEPVSILILGKTIQPYHFDDRGSRLCSYVVIGFAVSWIDLILERLIKQSRFAVWRKPVIRRCVHAATLFLALSCVGYKLFSREASGFRSHLRDDYYTHTPQTRPSYRESFAELASFLESNVRHDSVIASFDDQLFSWWITFHRGYWFLVEPFVSSLPDDELESRLALLCKLLGMSSQEYVEFIQHEYINVFFLGCEKYQASQWHSYSPLDDYTDQQRQRILQSDNVWQVIIPQSELRRLKRQYENVTMKEFDKRALDVIVLSNSGPEDKWAPPANAWELIFENNGFRVYCRAK
jgi:hypothetical protein